MSGTFLTPCAFPLHFSVCILPSRLYSPLKALTSMARLFQFELAGQTIGLAIARDYFYVLEDGSLLPIRHWPAWCERCKKFRVAEQIFSFDQEAKELAEVEYFAEHPGFIPPDRIIPVSSLAELRARARWRSQRTSPPKCLICGSTTITSIWPGPKVEIPGRGKCEGHFLGWGDMYSKPDVYYSPEGDRMAFEPNPRQR